MRVRRMFLTAEKASIDHMMVELATAMVGMLINFMLIYFGHAISLRDRILTV